MPPEIIINDDRTYLFQRKTSKQLVMAHTVSVRQLHSLLRINSFSCPQIAPRIDWFYLPAFLGRAWKQEKSVAPRLPSHLFIISSPCFDPLSAKLLFIFLSSLPCTCTSSGRLLPPTSLQRNPNPCSRVSVQGLFRGASWAGGGSLPEYQALPIARQLWQYHWQSGKQKKILL